MLSRSAALATALEALLRPMRALTQRLGARLVDEAETMYTPMRQRIEAVVRGLKRRAEMEIAAWRDMLAGLINVVMFKSSGFRLPSRLGNSSPRATRKCRDVFPDQRPPRSMGIPSPTGVCAICDRTELSLRMEPYTCGAGHTRSACEFDQLAHSSVSQRARPGGAGRA
jgi:hypothetical protein